MHSVSRTAIFGKIHKVLKKYYKPVAPPPERTVLEHLLFACVLEDARFEAAEEAFAALKHTFYDWNEVRVTSISELSEVMAALPDPRAAANRIKRVLHSIFEELYCFDLEEKRKKNLGPTIKWLEKMDGTSKFVVAYVVQAALAGHRIPVDSGTLAALGLLELVTAKEAAAGEVSGLERAVGKSKGVEFGSLLHQLGADYLANPFSLQVREVLLAIDPEASKRFPQRRQPRAETAPVPGSDAQHGSAPPANEVAGSPPASTARKRKTEVATAASPAAAESKAAEAKSVEGKKAAGSASKKVAEPPHESPASEKSRDKVAEKSPERPPKAEKPEKTEKQSKAERPEQAEKHEKRSAEASKAAPATDGLGKRKPR
jgi:endonuclease-3